MPQLNYRGVDIPPFVKVEKIEYSLFPKKTVKTINIPNRYGVISSGIDFGERIISAHVVILPQAPKTVMQKARELTAWLGTASGDLIVSDSSDALYKKVIVSNDVQINDVIYAGKGKIDFFCADPVAYYTAPREYTTALSNFYLTNRGEVDSYPVIDVTMASPKASWKFENSTTGSMILVTYSFQANDILTIDCAKKLIKVNGATNMKILDFSSDWLALIPGQNRFIKTPSGTDSVAFGFTEGWI